MPRLRLGVVLVVPRPLATEIDGLRRALGDPALDRIMPHVTLVPPVNVRTDAVDDALAVLRAAAAASRPLRLELGAPRTFGPDSPTLYLPVGGAAEDLQRLAQLRAAASTPPLHRTVDHDFVPHVTVAMELAPGRLAAGVEALGGYSGSFVADAITLLRYDAAPDRRAVDAGRPGGVDPASHDPLGAPGAPVAPGVLGPHWEPIADVRLGPPAVVGRGGIELELTTGSILDPEARVLLDDADRTAAALDWFARPGAHGVPPGARSVVVTARQRGVVVGVGWGHAWPGGGRGPGDGRGEVATVIAVRGVEREGIERQVELALESLIASG